jgi:hypothetical protein
MPEEGEGPKISQPASEGRNRPGGPLRMRPVEIQGKYYDPYHPPKLYQTPEGKQEYRGGKALDKDEAYSMMFWVKDKPEGLKEAMASSVEIAVGSGEFSSFVGATKGPDGKFELEQDSKEKLSAYRLIAREKGYQIGSFKYHENAGTVTAPIAKLEPNPTNK